MTQALEKITVDFIVFDLDGTLADSLADLAKAANYCSNHMGLPGHTPEAVKGMIGGGERKFIERVVGEGNENRIDECLGLYLEYYSRHCGDLTRAYPGVKETLKQLSRSKKLAVLTNKRQSLAECVIEVMGLSRFFAVIRGGGEELPLKPSPEPLKAVLQTLGADPARSLMVGDKPADVGAARGAGTYVAAVTYGYGELDALVAAGPDFIINQISQLLNIIEA
jgi:phosphoglycolate phosphatase